MIRETERLYLRAFNLKDAKRVTELLEDGEVFKTTLNVPYPYTEQMALDWIGLHSVWFANEHRYELAVILKESNEVIGVVGLSNDHKVGEIGYWIGYHYWNKGYGTEAAKALLDYAFNDLGYHKIHGRFFVTNPASGKIMQNLNMKKEGTLREHVYKNEEYIDLDLYSILKSEYELL